MIGTVSLRDSSSPPVEVTTEVVANSVEHGGSFKFNVRRLRPPFVLRAEIEEGGGTRRLHSICTGGEAVINPITNAALAGAAGGISPDEVYDAAEPEVTRRAAAALPVVTAELSTALAPLLEQYEVIDPIADPVAGAIDSMDLLLRDVDVEVNASAEVVVTNRRTDAVIYSGPSTSPSAGNFVAGSLPAPAEPIPQSTPAEPVPSEPAPADPAPADPAPAAADPAAPAAPPALYPTASQMTRRSMPSLSAPALGETIRFSDLGTTVTRAANTRHHYAKTSPWNVDESLAMTLDGRIYDGKTFEPIRFVTLPNEHKTWSNTDPRYIYGANKAQRQWVRVDATTGSAVALATYSQYSTVSYGAYEGNMDSGDTGAALIGNGNRPFLINPKTGAVRCSVTGGGGYGRSASDSTMSQDGRYMLVNWVGYGIDAYNASDCSFARKLTSRNSHYDACISSAGEQVVVQPGGSASIVMTRISDGAATAVYSDSSLRIHVSCRNTKRPGYAYVSVYNQTCDSVLTGMDAFHRIFSVKLDGSRATESYAWDHQPCPAPYNDNPMAVPSRDGSRVWWKVRWDGTLASYVAERR
jgi:hypothetical protein